MSKNTEDYIWAMQHAYCLLNADVQFGGALSRLPAGGIYCEALVEKAVAILKDALGDDVPPLEVSVARVKVALEELPMHTEGPTGHGGLTQVAAEG